VRTAAQESAATAEAMRASSLPASDKPAFPNQEGPTEASSAAQEEDLSPDEACIICFERQKVYAFTPCGHLAVCRLCAPLLDACPVCRGRRDGLLFVEPTSKLCVCKHCKHVIGPTFFDAHREVCALRMRNQEHTQATVQDADSELKHCIECRVGQRDHALLPCGHMLTCGPCAAKLHTCPQCCVNITGTMEMYRA
jgi:hypothetical protein